MKEALALAPARALRACCWPLQRVRAWALGRAGRALCGAVLMLGALWLAPVQAAKPAQAQAQAISVLDDRGRTVLLPQPPQRVVSVLPSLTETVCALGQCQRLVGVDRFSDWPAAVRALPQVGGGIDPNIEAIVTLRPDLVLMARSSRGSERLEALGLTVLVLEPQTHADVRRVMGRVAQALGLPAQQAEQLWQRIDADLTALARALPPSVRQTRVYFEVNRAPFAAGAASFIGESLARLGAQNIVPPELGPFPQLNPEFVVRANPDLIMVGARDRASLHERPGWGRIRAVREQRLCVFADAELDALVRPGPRLAEGARLLADCLRRHAP